MGSSVVFDAAAQLIRVREYGVLDAEEFARSVRSIRDISDREGCTRVLVDTREQRSRTEGGEAYDRAALAARTLAGTGIRVAVIASGPQLDDHGFFETVSVNRGLSLRVFADEASAREWLGV